MIGMIGRQFHRLFQVLRNAPSERDEHYDTWRDLKERKKRLDERAEQHRTQRTGQQSPARDTEV